MTDIDTRRALLLAGRLATAAQRVVDARVMDLGERLRELREAFLDYDEHMTDWHRREARGND